MTNPRSPRVGRHDVEQPGAPPSRSVGEPDGLPHPPLPPSSRPRTSHRHVPGSPGSTRRVLLAAVLVIGTLAAAVGPASTGAMPLEGLAATETIATTAPVAQPFPQHAARAAGTVAPDVPQELLDRDVRRAYRSWKRRYLIPEGTDRAGRPLYRVSLGRTDRAHTVSEGQGYGMLIAVTMAGFDPDAREIFDGLWRYARRYPSSIDPVLMSFYVPSTGGNSAFDGDADMAYALLLADAQWGSDTGLRYRRLARRVVRAIERSTIGPDSLLPMLGDWVDPDSPGRYNQYTWRTSDCMPAHFRAFATISRRVPWRHVASRCVRQLATLQRQYSHGVGLVPDFVVTRNGRPRPAPPGFLESDTDGSYGYNAFRVPWRIGLDAVLNGGARSRAVVGRVARWAAATVGTDPMAALGGGYRLDGNQLGGRDYFTTVVAAPLGVALMVTPEHRASLDAIYDAVRTRREDYYEDSVTLLCLLAISGNWIVP